MITTLDDCTEQVRRATAFGWTGLQVIGGALCGVPPGGIPQEVINELGDNAKEVVSFESVMKTAEEWRLTIAGHSMRNGYYTDDEIRAIQLDAMKEGMRRAAEIACPKGNILFFQVAQEARERGRDAILSAAEQLTEKDIRRSHNTK